MKNRWNKKISSWLLCMMLIVAMAFTMVGCGAKGNDGNNRPSTEAPSSAETPDVTEAPSSTETPDEAEPQDKAPTEDNVLGEGQTQFTFLVVDKDGKETSFEIHTDKTTVGEALLEVELIEGETGEYGLYVKKVNGITADYDVDQTYWAFYVNGEYASTGVDSTNIEEGSTYAFKVEK